VACEKYEKEFNIQNDDFCDDEEKENPTIKVEELK